MEIEPIGDTRTFGYARVSTEDQDLSLQLRALEAAGCHHVYTDKISGARNDRAGLEKVLRAAHPGDTLVVWKLDRLGRSVKGVLELIERLEASGVELRVLTEPIDTKTAWGRMVMTILLSLAQMERELTSERTRAGMAAKRAAGHIFGRRHSIIGFPERIEAMRPYIESGDVMTMHPQLALDVMNAAHDHLPKGKRPPKIKSQETFRRWRRDKFPGFAKKEKEG